MSFGRIGCCDDQVRISKIAVHTLPTGEANVDNAVPAVVHQVLDARVLDREGWLHPLIVHLGRMHYHAVVRRLAAAIPDQRHFNGWAVSGHEAGRVEREDIGFDDVEVLDVGEEVGSEVKTKVGRVRALLELRNESTMQGHGRGVGVEGHNGEVLGVLVSLTLVAGASRAGAQRTLSLLTAIPGTGKSGLIVVELHGAAPTVLVRCTRHLLVGVRVLIRLLRDGCGESELVEVLVCTSAAGRLVSCPICFPVLLVAVKRTETSAAATERVVLGAKAGLAILTLVVFPRASRNDTRVAVRKA